MCLFGFSKQDITPNVGCYLYGYTDDLVSESIHDRLSVNAFYFEDGDKKALMISAEVCSVNTVFSEKMRKCISEQTDIKYENIILHGIHNHTGPNTDGNCGWGDLDIQYCENILLPVTVEAVKIAKSNAVPAKFGFASGTSLIGINRREQDLNNNVVLGQCAWGSFDPRMAVIAFSDMSEKPIANLVYYTCHGTCAGLCKEISRDWAGGMIDKLTAFSGVPTAFFCGPEGDVGPRLSNGYTTGTMKDAEEMGEKAGEDAIKIYKTIRSYSPLEFCVSGKNVNLPLKNRISKEDALENLISVRDKSVNLDGQKRNYYERVLRSYDSGYEDKKVLTLPQTLIGIGDAVFVSYPYELFSDIALRINKAVKNYDIFCLSNANGSEGYFPCDSEISKGGYEIDMFLTHNLQPYCDNADFHLIKETLRNLEELLCIE